MIELGTLDSDEAQRARALMSRPDTVFAALLDRPAMWVPQNIGLLVTSFPQGLIDEGDLFLIITECLGNAVLHGQAELLGIYARLRGPMLLLTFYQHPLLLPRIKLVLKLAHEHGIQAYSEQLPGGMGLPILAKLVHRMSVTEDLTRFQLWIRVPKP